MELELLRTQLEGMGHVISDKEFMIHVLANLPEEYESKVKSWENGLDNKDDSMTLDYMLVELDTKYQNICRKNNRDAENDDEKKRKNNNQGTALTTSRNGVFKGRCYVC